MSLVISTRLDVHVTCDVPACPAIFRWDFVDMAEKTLVLPGLLDANGWVTTGAMAEIDAPQQHRCSAHTFVEVVP